MNNQFLSNYPFNKKCCFILLILKENTMKNFILMFMVIGTVLIFFGCENEVQPTESAIEVDETESLEKCFRGNRWEKHHDKLLDKFLTAMNTKDIDTFMECWLKSPDAVLVIEIGWIVQGWDNIRAGVQNMMETTTNLHLEVIDRCIYSVGLATWTRDNLIFQEVWTDVATISDGKLVFVMDHAHDLTPFPAQPDFP